MFGKYINKLIIYYAIFKGDNVFMNQMSQMVSMELNMFDLTMGNIIVNNLYDTLVITVDCSRGMKRKAKFSQKLGNPYFFIIGLNNATIFYSIVKIEIHFVYCMNTPKV
jgi:hypothetical protein